MSRGVAVRVVLISLSLLVPLQAAVAADCDALEDETARLACTVEVQEARIAELEAEVAKLREALATSTNDSFTRINSATRRALEDAGTAAPKPASPGSPTR